MKRLLIAAMLIASAVRAQEEPTPFWLPPPPETKQPAKPKKRKPAPAKPAPSTEPVQPTWIEPAPPQPAEPSPPPESASPAAEPVPSAAEPVPRAAGPAPRVAEPAPEPPRPIPVDSVPQPAAVAPPPAPLPAVTSPPAAAAPGPSSAAAPPPSASRLRRWSVSAIAGAWGKSTSDASGRSWQLTWGARAACAVSPSLDLDLTLARAGATAGSPFVNASLTHSLALLRAFWVLGDAYALLLGGGGGIALAETHYSLLPSTEAGVAGSGLDAVALKSVIAITAAARARLFGGLEARAEVSALARDGRLELLPLLGAGWAF